MASPRLLDLYCCAGGSSVGYHRAGFNVVGVDKDPQPNYPFEFIRADVLDLSPAFLKSFDAIHASPPCQGYSAMRHAPGARGAPRLIGRTRRLLIASGRPWIMENVEEARDWMSDDAVTLCGSMFDLGAQGCWLKRHRLFEANFPLTAPACRHPSTPVIGVYGGHARRRAASAGGRGTRDPWEGGHRAAASQALRMNWASMDEICEAVPPAYTEFLGIQLRVHVDLERVAA